MWSRKWRESWKIDSEEEVVLTAVQEKVSRGRVTEGQFKFGFRAGVKDRF